MKITIIYVTKNSTVLHCVTELRE